MDVDPVAGLATTQGIRPAGPQIVTQELKTAIGMGMRLVLALIPIVMDVTATPSLSHAKSCMSCCCILAYHFFVHAVI